jgi:hypothetical protein
LALFGTAALAMWWDMAPQHRAEFAHWHAHEHFPERLAIPGFQRASRWSSRDGGDGVFVLYELLSHSVLQSPAYRARLDAPTPWSTRLMPHHRGMVRSQCHVVDSAGAVTGAQLLTIRLSPRAGQEAALRKAVQTLASTCTDQPGLVGLHLLQHASPSMAPTTEQQLRGLSDGAADWVLLACGYDAAAVAALATGPLSAARLRALGAEDGVQHGHYELAYCALPGDVAELGTGRGSAA